MGKAGHLWLPGRCCAQKFTHSERKGNVNSDGIRILTPCISPPKLAAPWSLRMPSPFPYLWQVPKLQLCMRPSAICRPQRYFPSWESAWDLLFQVKLNFLRWLRSLTGFQIPPHFLGQTLEMLQQVFLLAHKMEGHWFPMASGEQVEAFPECPTLPPTWLFWPLQASATSLLWMAWPCGSNQWESFWPLTLRVLMALICRRWSLVVTLWARKMLLASSFPCSPLFSLHSNVKSACALYYYLADYDTNLWQIVRRRHQHLSSMQQLLLHSYSTLAQGSSTANLPGMDSLWCQVHKNCCRRIGLLAANPCWAKFALAGR